MILHHSIRLRLGPKLFLSHFLIVLLVFGSIGTFFYFSAMQHLLQSLRSRLQNSAALLSQMIDARDLEAIRSEADTRLPGYLDALTKLRRLRLANPDIAFLFIMRKEGEQIRFVIDSDESDRQALPGREYQDAPALLQAGFQAPSVDDKPYGDEWGLFLSGYAPLRNGQGRYLLGIDMRADVMEHKLSRLRQAGLISLLASLLLAMLFALYFSSALTGRIQRLIQCCRRIATGHFEKGAVRAVDELDDLAEAFNAMAVELEQMRRKADQALEELRESRDHLEQHVQERTRELEQTLEKVQVLSGLLPICSACKKIRNDQGYWQQVEQFVSMHTGARFSHSLCPECGLKLYGDLLSKKTLDALNLTAKTKKEL